VIDQNILASQPEPSSTPSIQGTNKQALGLTLSVVIPTFNEAANVEPLIERLYKVLEGVNWEVIFVDDD
jgi:hypothetical protein